ncbi:hypothetical protein [Pseudomonas phage Itty13]|jgi:hypothetical protein|uniref:Uncharacterized protein n=1 Tax=Pseudomonas phage Itty13 TaxID=2805750 RepID=A0A889IQY0_9CAUD|nr:hypothetical protein PQC19_gp34 [Pseudomonas phage Itty13]QRE00610.1 hypothetical protein [Pseudomonas phage Itty13]
MNAALARLQNKRAWMLRDMLSNRWHGFSFAGHPWAKQIRAMHDEAKCIREHHGR